MNMIRRLFFITCLCGLVAPALSQSENNIRYEEVSPGLWIHESTLRNIKSNGLIFVNGTEITLVDTPWNDEQTRQLLEWIQTNLKRPVTRAIITHSHEDRAGGARALNKAGIPMQGHDQTGVIVQRELGVSISTIVSRGKPVHETDTLEVFYPGPGHTRDNVVVWFPKQQVLFGGCFLKSATTTGMGYVKESDIIEWPKSVSRLAQRYPNAKVLIPGHGKQAGMDTIENTTQLLSEYIKANHTNSCSSCLSDW